MAEENSLHEKPEDIKPPAADSDNIRLSFSLTRADILWYNLHFARFIVLGLIAFFMLFVIGLIAIVSAPKGDLQIAFIWIEMAIGIGFSICAGIIAAIVIQIYFQKTASVKQAMAEKSYIIDSTGITVFDDSHRIVRSWQDILKIITTRRGFYFRTGDKLAIVIPRRVLKDSHELKAFENILVAHS
jgi:hypothetical protein